MDRGRVNRRIDRTIPSAVLGAARLQIVGSGQGSLATSEMVADLAALAQAITDGTLTVDAHPMPLAEVERAWSDAGRTTERIVLRP